MYCKYCNQWNGWVLNRPLGRTGPEEATANLVDTSANLSKQFGDYCNLEFNDLSYDHKMSISQNDQCALEIMESTVKL